MRASGTLRLDQAGAASGPVVGAIPFAPADAAVLFRPERFTREPRNRLAGSRTRLSRDVRLVPIPAREEYTRLVAGIVKALRAHRERDGVLRKVVLARRLDVIQSEPIDVEGLAAWLSRDRKVTTFLLRTFDEDGAPTGALVGASPELLVEKRGRTVYSAPLAGSAPRSGNTTKDRAAADQLLASSKDREEHRLVVEYVLDTLAPFCTGLRAPATPSPACTDTMWHLETRVEGCLKDEDTPSFVLARQLHPTPAVCGVPSDESARLIAELEPFSRGLYGGAVGWSDALGNGRWVVALRCAEVVGTTASLFAGAGILPESDPAAECDETSDKFRALLSGFGIMEPVAGQEDKAE